MKAATRSTGSSFHGTTIYATPNELISLANKLGANYSDCNGDEDKTNFDFDFETDNGVYFTVYDWKEYRTLDLNETIRWNIGGETANDTREAVVELARAIQDNNN